MNKLTCVALVGLMVEFNFFFFKTHNLLTLMLPFLTSRLYIQVKHVCFFFVGYSPNTNFTWWFFRQLWMKLSFCIVITCYLQNGALSPPQFFWLGRWVNWLIEDKSCFIEFHQNVQIPIDLWMAFNVMSC